MRFEILSVRGENRIPLKYESEGIKKLISILSILIAMYNNASVCVAVDEFDAGIYEYLLGEILRILEESGRGQLIFTSHNPSSARNDRSEKHRIYDNQSGKPLYPA